MKNVADVEPMCCSISIRFAALSDVSVVRKGENALTKSSKLREPSMSTEGFVPSLANKGTYGKELVNIILAADTARSKLHEEKSDDRIWYAS